MRRKVYDAYFTVEASFIIPITFLLIILTLQYGFFCYEKSLSLQSCYLAALRASNEWDMTSTESERYAQEEAISLLEERNVYPVRKEIKANANLLGIEVEIEGTLEALFKEARGNKVDGWELDSKKSAIKTVPSQYIRKYHMIRTAGGENDGNNQQK